MVVGLGGADPDPLSLWTVFYGQYKCTGPRANFAGRVNRLNLLFLLQMITPNIDQICTSRPPDLFLKCNSDAIIFESSQAAGFGAVIRNSIGDFIACGSRADPGIRSLKEAEAMAL